MNRYQKYLMNDGEFLIYTNEKITAKKSNPNRDRTGEFTELGFRSLRCYSNDRILIQQDEDISVGGYVFYVIAQALENVYAIKNGSEIPFNENTEFRLRKNFRCFNYPISFDDKIQAIKIVFKNNLADDLIIPVELIEADKEKYRKKVEKAQKEKELTAKKANNDALLAKAMVKHSTGSDLVNIYFQPCCDAYEKTEIELYLAKTRGAWSKEVTGIVSYSRVTLTGGEPEQLIGRYKIDDGSLFKSITGLAKRVYAYKIRQLDAENNILCESDFVYFMIQ